MRLLTILPEKNPAVGSEGIPAAPPSTLVLNRRNPPARSPTPPNRVIKSTYGGNLFTSDDVLYLKRYIDYCQEQGLVLSLREICERIAVKAPHHTFYSWRRYCNKHQIRLGGYSMDLGDAVAPQEEGEQEQNEAEQQLRVSTGPGIIAAAQQRLQQEGNQPRNRSPTPPRALFRSTTGKGVAFTEQDVTFLVRFMEYRKSQDRFDMVAFWKDVATKAPHHSRASWMKFWRRHKHELNRTEGDDPLPQPPEKKMRYSRSDDILLAKYFFTKPEGTSDKIFQAFGRLRLVNGENIDIDDNAADSEFFREGYICIPNFLSQDQVSSLLQRSKELLADFSLEDHPLTKFTTSDKNHVGDDYFLKSGDKIRYFLEEEAVNENGQLTKDKTKAVNKIGHALHVLDPVFRSVTLENDKLKAVVKDLKFHHDPVALQSMIIFKQPEIGGAGN
ncbi:hypothetical protein J3R82DRAFT_10535 [Butyriboletus roseoflavus]|nr:hypothetical protein J3R82DRAFT_10535 [Butyriboletus roseoflavus]